MRAVALVCAVAVGVAQRTCQVVDFGALCDAVTDDTVAVQRALDACSNYSGVVELPATGTNRTCLSFPLDFHNGTQLHIPEGSTLKAFPSVARWPNATRFNFVELKHRRDVAVFGAGVIDGSGEVWYPVPIDELNGERPRLFHMESIRNISFRGVTLRHTAGGSLGFNTPCWDVVVDGIRIDNPSFGNTDGIDISCDGALVQNSRVVNGDDSICMKSGAKNVLVRNCSVANGAPWPGQAKHGLAGGLVLGTSDDDSMQNITYRNCTVDGALAGVRVKFRPTQQGYVRGVVFEDIVIRNPVAYAVDVILSSDHSDASPAGAPGRGQALGRSNGSGAGALRAVNVTGLVLRDIRGTLGPVPQAVCGAGKTCPRAVGRFSCAASFACTGLVMERFHVQGFNASAQYPVPCTWDGASGSGNDVLPAGCMPPRPLPSMPLPRLP